MKTEGRPGSENRSAEKGWRVRLWLPVTEGRPHAVAVANYAEAHELARAKEGGGHHTEYDVVCVEVEYPGRRAT